MELIDPNRLHGFVTHFPEIAGESGVSDGAQHITKQGIPRFLRDFRMSTFDDGKQRILDRFLCLLHHGSNFDLGFLLLDQRRINTRQVTFDCDSLVNDLPILPLFDHIPSRMRGRNLLSLIRVYLLALHRSQRNHHRAIGTDLHFVEDTADIDNAPLRSCLLRRHIDGLSLLNILGLNRLGFHGNPSQELLNWIVPINRLSLRSSISLSRRMSNIRFFLGSRSFIADRSFRFLGNFRRFSSFLGFFLLGHLDGIILCNELQIIEAHITGVPPTISGQLELSLHEQLPEYITGLLFGMFFEELGQLIGPIFAFSHAVLHDESRGAGPPLGFVSEAIVLFTGSFSRCRITGILLDTGLVLVVLVDDALGIFLDPVADLDEPIAHRFSDCFVRNSQIGLAIVFLVCHDFLLSFDLGSYWCPNDQIMDYFDTCLSITLR